MPAKFWIALALLFALPPAHAAETDDVTLEVIEMLGEIDDAEIELEIAMADIEKINERVTPPQEVKDAE
ncbi:MAG: hypothetical protein Q7U91_09510 [Sideroxyarcus sp.]|nr:hypothetical protein [Sideroxyarcus sp.]